MKGFLSRLGGPPAHSIGGDSLGGGGGVGAGFAGRQFSLSRHQVVVEEKLAEGGFALVFRVRSQTDGRVYALKRMCVNDEPAMQACMLEVSLVRSISHRNVVRYADHAVHHLPNGVREILLLMVYYRRSLSDLLNRCAQTGSHLPEQQALGIFCDVCSAVAQLHLRHPPVQHRDLKAENVLAGDDPSASGGGFVLCDFGSASERPLSTAELGVARVEEEIQKYTTLAYRSPEMVNLYSGAPIDSKSDIWALGCLLYRLAYLGLPFGESSLAISSARLCLPDWPARSAGLRRLIGYALRPEPRDRPDIVQLARLACNLAGRQCDVAGGQAVQIPQLDSLPLPPSESEMREAAAALQLKRSPSTGHLQAQQHQPPQSQKSSGAMSGSATPTCARQRPRPGGAVGAVLQAPQAQHLQPPMTADAGAQGQQFRHRRQVSDTSALMTRPPVLQQHQQQPAVIPTDASVGAHRQRVVSLAEPSAPQPQPAPAEALLVDLDAPPSAPSSAAPSASFGGGGGWAAPDAPTMQFQPGGVVATPLEDSAFGDEFDKIRCFGSTNVSAPLLPPILAAAPAAAPAPAPAPAAAAALGSAAPRQVVTVQQQQQLTQSRPPPQHRHQHSWGGPGPRHPSQLMNQQVFWPT